MSKQPRDYLIELTHIFFAERRLIKRVFVVGFVFLLFVSFFSTKLYYFNSQVVVVSKHVSQSLDGSVLNSKQDMFVPPSLTDMETEANILRSHALVYRTMKQMHRANRLVIDEPPSWLKANIVIPLKDGLKTVKSTVKSWLSDPLTPEQEEHIYLTEMTELVVESLEIITLPGSNILTVGLMYDDMIIGERIANALLQNYLTLRRDLMLSNLSDDFYYKNKTLLQQQIQDLEMQKLALLKEFGASLPALEMEAEVEAIEKAQAELESYKLEVKEKQNWQLYLEREYDRIALSEKPDDYEFPYTFNTSPREAGAVYQDEDLYAQREILRNLSSSYRNVTRIYEEDTRAHRDVVYKLKVEREKYLKLIHNKIAESEQDLHVAWKIALDKVNYIESLSVRINQLREVLPRYDIVETELKALQDAYFAYTQRYYEYKAQRLSGVDSNSNVRVLAWPQTPLKPAFPNPKLMIPIGSVALIMLAVSIGFIKAFFIQRFERPEQVTERLGLPIIAVIDDQDQFNEPKTKPTGFFSRIKHWCWD